MPEVDSSQRKSNLSRRPGFLTQVFRERIRRGPGFSPRTYHLILAVGLALATIVFALYATELLYNARYSVTRQDYWRIYRLDLRVPFPFNALYKHNDHPVFFPTLVWLPILHFFHNDQTLLFWCGFALTISTLLLLLLGVWRSPSLGLVPRCALALLATVACLWLGKANIIASGGFSCMNSMTMSAFVVGLLVLDRKGETPSGRGRALTFLGVAAAGTVASFSFGTGLAAWPALLCVALLRGRGWKFTGGLGALGLLNAAIFLSIPNNGKTEIGRGLSNLWSKSPTLAVRYLEVLGAPWAHGSAGWLAPRDTATAILIAALLGGSGFLLAIYLFILRLRSGRVGEPAETVALGLLLFILGSVGLIVLGRGELMAVSPRETLAPRYCFWTPFFWLALPTLALYCWPRLRLRPTILTLITLVLAGAALPSQSRFGANYAFMRKATEDAALRLLCGVEDESSLQLLFRSDVHSANAIRPLRRIYRERGLDMYAWPGASLVGKLQASMGKPELGDDLRMLGQWQVDRVLETLRKDLPAARFSGWCLTREKHRPAEYVLISQLNGRVVGLGRFTVDRPNLNRKYRISSRHVLGFRGYIQNYSSKRRYQCRAVVNGKPASSELLRIGPDS